MLFKIHQNNQEKMEIGIANITIKENESIENLGITIYGFNTGKSLENVSPAT